MEKKEKYHREREKREFWSEETEKLTNCGIDTNKNSSRNIAAKGGRTNVVVGIGSN